MTASPASAEDQQQHANGVTSQHVNEDRSTETKKKNWQIFPGRNKFYCDGRIIMAKQTGVLYFTLSLIFVTVALFYAFDCRLTLVTKISYGFFIPITSGLLFFFTMFCLLRTAWSDPGIIPRASPEEAAYIEKCIQAEETEDENASNYRSVPRSLDIVINGSPMKLKFCFTCKIFRPPRASHCSLCDNCVENFDHHCPWVGNCVGRRNYRFFYMFVTSLSILCLFIFSFAIVNIVILSQEYGFVEAIKQSPGSILEIVVCFLSVWSVLGLAGFHSFLISKSQTTNEDIKRTWSNKRGDKAKNPFDRGSCPRNFFFTLCSPIPTSAIDRRGYATAKQISDYEVALQRPNGVSYGSNANQPRQSSQPYPTMENAPSYPRQPTYVNPESSVQMDTSGGAAQQVDAPPINDKEPTVTITHHALPAPSTHFSHNTNNSTHYQHGCHSNEIAMEDDRSSNSGVVIEHLGPGSTLVPSTGDVMNDSVTSTASRTRLIDDKRKLTGNGRAIESSAAPRQDSPV